MLSNNLYFIFKTTILFEVYKVLNDEYAKTFTRINRARGEVSTSDQTLRKWFQKFKAVLTTNNCKRNSREMSQTLGVNTETILHYLQRI